MPIQHSIHPLADRISQCLQRGIKLMKMMETGEKIPPTPFKKVERIEKNGWTEISTNKLVQPSINSLIWGEECKKVFKFSYHEVSISARHHNPQLIGNGHYRTSNRQRRTAQ